MSLVLPLPLISARLPSQALDTSCLNRGQDMRSWHRFLRLLVQQRCAAWGEGSHWIEEGEIDVETAPSARDSDNEQLDTGDVLS